MDPDELIIINGWLVGNGVRKIPMDPSWYSGVMIKPQAIVAHYTATDPGTAVNMAERRTKEHTAADRQASWHVSIDSIGEFPIVQMAPLNARCWHAGGKGSKPIPGVGKANKTAVGIELVGHGKVFPEAQVGNAARVWRAIVRQFRIRETLAMIQHSDLSPHDRSDPGVVWMTKYAPFVLKHAYS
jgi:N-acetyl-anhydromuramyl-L-alanine amidase AmpD